MPQPHIHQYSIVYTLYLKPRTSPVATCIIISIRVPRRSPHWMYCATLQLSAHRSACSHALIHPKLFTSHIHIYLSSSRLISFDLPAFASILNCVTTLTPLSSFFRWNTNQSAGTHAIPQNEAVARNIHGFGAISRRTASSKPIIAAVNGHAFGGGMEMILGCDLVVASSEAKLALPEVVRGVVAIQGGEPAFHYFLFARYKCSFVVRTHSLHSFISACLGLALQGFYAGGRYPSFLPACHHGANGAYGARLSMCY